MSEFQAAAVDHIRRLSRLIDRGGVARVKKIYDQAQAELEKKLARSVGRGSSPFTVMQHRSLLAQVRQGQMHIARQMGVASGQATVETQKDALHSLVKSVKRLEAKHGSGGVFQLPIEEAARFQGVLDRRRTSLLAQNATSMAKYGTGVVKDMEGQLTLSLATGETAHEAMDRVAATADVSFWKAERIVRTEQAWAYNATQRDGIADSAAAMPDLWMRWTELVDDSTLEPLDDRVGADSVALHGQVAKPGDMFTMPTSALSVHLETRYGKSRVDPDMIGKSWAHPPNRPNDRSSIMPWSPSWGDAPGWRVVAGQKVPVRAPRQR